VVFVGAITMTTTESEIKIKGSIFLIFVKIIRGSKDERLYRYLNEEDKKIISGRVFPSGWYPMDTFWHCLRACYEVFGEKKPKNAREWGRVMGIQLLTGTYKDVLPTANTDLPSAVKTFTLISKTFFSHSHFELVSLEGRNAKLKLTQVSDNSAAMIFYFIICGFLEKYIELAGGKNCRTNFSEMVENDNKTVVFDANWE